MWAGHSFSSAHTGRRCMTDTTTPPPTTALPFEWTSRHPTRHPPSRLRYACEAPEDDDDGGPPLQHLTFALAADDDDGQSASAQSRIEWALGRAGCTRCQYGRRTLRVAGDGAGDERQRVDADGRRCGWQARRMPMHRHRRRTLRVAGDGAGDGRQWSTWMDDAVTHAVLLLPTPSKSSPAPISSTAPSTPPPLNAPSAHAATSTSCTSTPSARS
ncbi:hypothetical protein BJ912DRAFT_949077 [Pholiota molesta]|nr:hypothetical protein BJ912DRAFT_949077 [Pholiota molesta]